MLGLLFRELLFSIGVFAQCCDLQITQNARQIGLDQVHRRRRKYDAVAIWTAEPAPTENRRHASE